MKIAIFGAGSIGCYLGGLLAHSGAEVMFIGRARFKDDIDAHGLKLSHYLRDPVFIPAGEVDYSMSSADIADADIVLVTVKSQATHEAAQDIQRHAKRDALIISFQNGVTNAEALEQVLSDHTVLAAVVPFNVTGTGPGAFHCGTEGDLIVKDVNDVRLDELSNLFEDAGQILKRVPNIRSVQWGKLLVNLNNALNTLYGGTLRSGLMQRDYRRVLSAQMSEAISIIQGAGETTASFGKASPEQTLKILKLPNWLFSIVMNFILKIDENARSSMLDDLEMGRESEIDYLQGAITQLAKDTGQSAPINEAVYKTTLQAFERGKSPRMSGADMLMFLK